MTSTVFGLFIGLGVFLFFIGFVEWVRATGPWGLNGLIYWLLSAGCFTVVLVLIFLIPATLWVTI